MAYQLQYYRDTIPDLQYVSVLHPPSGPTSIGPSIHPNFFYRRPDIHAALHFSRLIFESGQENKPFETPDREMWSTHDRCLQPILDLATKYKMPARGHKLLTSSGR